ncbi:MAG TPA: ATP-binding protein, partial [Steroidobacteraceae bacterium]
GPGIPAEKHAEIFQEFAQLGNPERDRRKGLGLGLAIVERLATLLGHSVELRSTVGKGSVFAVTVARGRHDDQALLDLGAGIAACFDLSGRLALLIQGDSAGREARKELLLGWNCEVVTAASGAEMLANLAGLRRLPDLIIADGPAPGENGAAVVDMLRSEFNVEVPALLVGAPPGPAVERADLPVLHRPFHPGRLRTLINNLLHAPVTRARRAS